MTKQVRLAAALLGGVLGLSLLAPTAAHAGREGRRNTALLLGAVAAYGIVKKQPALAGIATAAIATPVTGTTAAAAARGTAAIGTAAIGMPATGTTGTTTAAGTIRLLPSRRSWSAQRTGSSSSSKKSPSQTVVPSGSTASTT